MIFSLLSSSPFLESLLTFFDFRLFSYSLIGMSLPKFMLYYLYSVLRGGVIAYTTILLSSILFLYELAKNFGFFYFYFLSVDINLIFYTLLGFWCA